MTSLSTLAQLKKINQKNIKAKRNRNMNHSKKNP